MRKLKLDVGSLRVESFEASVGKGPEGGTVRANDATSLCSGGATCNYTACQNTCQCPHTSPQPSCQPCSWDDCVTADRAACP